MRNEIIDKQFDEERALYNLLDTDVIDCVFAGPADGESALKEASSIRVENCDFSLRYPMWHVKDFSLIDSRMDEKARAAIWYGINGKISGNFNDTGFRGENGVRKNQRNLHVYL